MAIHAHKPGWRRALRASLVSHLLCAERALSDDPDLASLYLDGALRDLLALALDEAQDDAPCVSPVDALSALEARRPPVARWLRLALRAPNIEARLAHCWRLVDLLHLRVASDARPAFALKG